MTNKGKMNVVGVLVDAVDYEAATERVIAAASGLQPLSGAALAVHGVMTGALSKSHRGRLNHIDLTVPDGQPVRWALNLLYHASLSTQVRGTTLTLNILARAERERLPVFFYGSNEDVLEQLVGEVRRRFPRLVVAGTEPSKFRTIEEAEAEAIAGRIRESGARIVFVGLGCPRQERFVSAMRDRVGLPLIAVGAAFDYLAGTLPEPPERLRRVGLEWLWRLSHEPRRLWRRYMFLNPAYLALLAAQAIGVWKPDADVAVPRSDSGIPG
jgi:exopolysaccharide biosynthesis WecB/TagA/CpsF family protein